MARLRIRRVNWPRAALVLTDTPRPACRTCDGDGGTAYGYGDYKTGEYAGTDWEPCPCWDEHRRWTLLPLPRLPRRLRRANAGYSDEPPF
ncbi:hypothetical protein LRS74_22645 [Streptomyces sp. LX-29]|uniref:hypothetical protein n=1 Tax=Streptomyces sp. LX-29 TaxID=2900152 RepID=UPI00240E6BD2|nr:hypothetical protein [Streptomyces sp. LX-29]WFB09534.1 hypothetical protein LRS74_22645 [Streptomyces sp. LX-29]